MDRRQLGHTGLSISAVGFGAWAIGGSGWAYGWGSQDDDDSVRTIRCALEHGINWIDTAAVYGFGHSERVVRRAISGNDASPLLFTKCSRVWDSDGAIRGVLDRASIRRELCASLERLGVKQLDLYQIHQPEPDQKLEEGWATLSELKSEGLVRFIGVSNFSIEQLRRVHAVATIDTVQLNYSLINRRAEKDIFPFCAANGIGVLAYAPMASGLLTGTMTRERLEALPKGDWRRGDNGQSRGRPLSMVAQFQEPQLSQNLALVEKMREMGARSGHSPGQLAIAWVLRNPVISGAIVGFRHPRQVSQILGCHFTLEEDEARELDTLSAGSC